MQAFKIIIFANNPKTKSKHSLKQILALYHQSYGLKDHVHYRLLIHHQRHSCQRVNKPLMHLPINILL